MIGIQLVGMIIGLGALHLTYLYYRKLYFTGRELIFWGVLWCAVIIVSLLPRLIEPIVGYLGLYRPMDLIMIIAFIILFVLVFQNYLISRQEQRKLERLIRELTQKDDSL